ncbi:MAG: polysaccharide deacetylase family protein [Chitinophagaceae bacterium]
MSLYKNIYYKGSSILPHLLLNQITAVNVLLPYHHLVSDERLPHIQNLYPYKNTNQFISDLDLLLTHFKPIDPVELIDCLRLHKPIPRRSFLLSFDDGLREVYDTVAPILKRKGVTALFFLNPAFLDNKELFYRFKLSLILEKLKGKENNRSLLKPINEILGLRSEHFFETSAKILSINYLNRSLADQLGLCLDIDFDEYLQMQKPFLSVEQVKEMKLQGFYFGGHSIDHPHYNLLHEDEQLRQTIESCRQVKQTLELTYTAFSFPHEDAGISKHFFEQLDRDEFKIDILFGTQNQKYELHKRMLHRFNAERPQLPLNQLVKGVLLYNGIATALHRNYPIRN